METTTSMQRPEKSAIISARPLISRVLLPGSSESTSSMTYRHQETGKGLCRGVQCNCMSTLGDRFILHLKSC